MALEEHLAGAFPDASGLENVAESHAGPVRGTHCTVLELVARGGGIEVAAVVARALHCHWEGDSWKSLELREGITALACDEAVNAESPGGAADVRDGEVVSDVKVRIGGEPSIKGTMRCLAYLRLIFDGY